MTKYRTMPISPTTNMINAAYMLIETMSKGTEARHKRIVAEVWKTMAEFAPSAEPPPMTPRQVHVHRAIHELITETGKSPTYEEIGRRVGRTKNDIHYILKSMRRRGILTYREGHRRSIQLLALPSETNP